MITAETLPAWLTLTDLTDGTATLTGTAPLADEYNLGFLVELRAESGGEVARQRFLITVFREAESLPEFTSMPTLTVAEGASYSYDVVVTSASPVAITAPTLPAWLILTDAEDGTAELIGSPPSVEADTDYPVRLRATTGLGSTEQIYTVTVEAAP